VTPQHPAPATDPTQLYRLRDGIYAADLLIVVAAELDLFSWLARHGPADVTQLRQAHDLDARATDVTLTYLVARGLLERLADGRLSPTEAAREHLVAGSPYDLRPYYASLLERPSCRALSAVLRTGRPQAWATAGDGKQWVDRLDSLEFATTITAAMDARGRFLGPALAEAVDDVPMQRILDVGGGSGIYGAALADRRPERQVDVLERPPVDAAARALLADRGYSGRVGVRTGDMLAALPDGYDTHLYSHVLHDWDEKDVRRMFARSFESLPADGWLLIHDTHIDADKSGPLPVAEYSVLLMQATEGKCWSVGELADMLTDNGFHLVECRPTAADRSVVLARRSG
jgi:predicted O-methyltransferase YrrM